MASSYLRRLRHWLSPWVGDSAALRERPRQRRRPSIEILEDRTVPTVYSIASTFTSTAIAPGGKIWFNSEVNTVTGVSGAPATIHVTNQTISFSDTNNGVTTNYNLSLP